MREWGASDICGLAELFSYICNPRSETEEDACTWRFACIQVSDKMAGLAAAHEVFSSGVALDCLLFLDEYVYILQMLTRVAEDAVLGSRFGPQDVLRTANLQLQAALKQGPYGYGTRAAPAIATDMR